VETLDFHRHPAQAVLQTACEKELGTACIVLLCTSVRLCHLTRRSFHLVLCRRDPVLLGEMCAQLPRTRRKFERATLASRRRRHHGGARLTLVSVPLQHCLPPCCLCFHHLIHCSFHLDPVLLGKRCAELPRKRRKFCLFCVFFFGLIDFDLSLIWKRILFFVFVLCPIPLL